MFCYVKTCLLKVCRSDNCHFFRKIIYNNIFLEKMWIKSVPVHVNLLFVKSVLHEKVVEKTIIFF